MDRKQTAIGLDLGGTSLKYALIDRAGNILSEGQRKIEALYNVEQMQTVFLEVTNELKQYAADNDLHVLGVGFGTPGSVEIDTGFMPGNSPNLPNWKDVNIKELFKSTGLECFPDNDANLAAWGEYYWSVGEKARNMIYLTLGTGIGGGMILNGALYRGSFFRGAELGHMTIDFHGRSCKCGGTGCFEQYASTTALLAEYEAISGERLANARVFFEKIENKDTLAQKTLDIFYNYLAAGLSSLINIFNPDEIVIGGGISAAEKFDTGEIARRTREKAMKNAVKNVVIRKARLYNQAGVMGGAAMVFEEESGE